MGEKKIAIVGVGPVGGILGGYLLQSGRDVTLIDIFEEHMSRIRSEGLVLDGQRPLTARFENSYRSIPEAVAHNQKFDLIYVCVKAPVVKLVAGELPAALAEGGAVVSFQNGLDTERGILDVIGPERTLRGVVNYAGNLVEPGRILKTFFNPPNYVGAAVPGNAAADALAREVAALMSESILTTEFSDNIQWHVWEKAIRNAALMPISALSGQNMAQVMGFEPSLHLVEKLLAEEIEIAKAVGFEFDKNFYDDTLRYFRKAGYHMPSMRGDVLDGRRTEIEFLNHKIAEYGEKHGIPCPYNRAIANLVMCADRVAAERRQKTA